MGMSSSQARLLSLTARMHDIEYKAQRIEAQKLQLANDSSRVYEDYIRALDATKLQYKTIDKDGSVKYVDATLAALENGLIPGYTGLTSQTPFFLKDTVSGALYISKDYAASIGVATDSDIFTGSLNEWLRQNNAPTKETQVVDYDNVIVDTSKINSIQTVGNSNYSDYTDPYYTYKKAVSNTTEILSSTLVSGKTYSVSTAGELVKLAELINAGQDTTGVTIILGSNIDMSGVSGFSSINNFKGTFDGNGKTISNLNKSMFDTLNGADVSNLEIKNSNIAGSGSVGALANKSTNSEIYNIKITNCTINSTGSNVGALIGLAIDTNISNCSTNGSVSGRSSVGGFVGYENGSTINNCSSSGNVNGCIAIGGFVGTASSGTIINSSANCIINIDATGIGHPDSGGFAGIASGTTFNYCEAKGSLSDNTIGEPTVCSGFLGCTGIGGGPYVTIFNSDSYVQVSTNAVVACGFASAHSDTPLILTNCNYHSSVSSTSGAVYNFVYGASSGAYVNVTNCTSTDSGHTNTENVNGGITYTSIPATNEINVNSPVLMSYDLSSDAISVQSLNAGVATIPSITKNTSYGSYNSNIFAALVKAGKYDYKNATSSDLLNMQQSISDYLALFNDTATDNSKLYYMNEKIVNYLNGNNSDEGIVNALWTDINNRSISATVNYQNGNIISGAQRSSTNKTWVPTYHEITKGTLTIPNKNTIKANLKAAIAKAGDSISDSQINAFFNLYGSSQQDYAYLAYINEVIEQYSQNIRSLSEITDAVKTSPATKITKIPSCIDDVENYNITMTSADQSSNVIINYGTTYGSKTVTDFDYENEIKKNLIQAYEVQKNGYIIIGDGDDVGMDHSTEWLTNMLNDGNAILIEVVTEKGESKNVETNVSTNTKIQEVANEKELKKQKLNMKQI